MDGRTVGPILTSTLSQGNHQSVCLSICQFPHVFPMLVSHSVSSAWWILEFLAISQSLRQSPHIWRRMKDQILSISQSLSSAWGIFQFLSISQSVSHPPYIWRRMEGGILSVSQSCSLLYVWRKMKGQILSVSQSVNPPYIWRRIEDGILSVSQSVRQYPHICRRMEDGILSVSLSVPLYLEKDGRWNSVSQSVSAPIFEKDGRWNPVRLSVHQLCLGNPWISIHQSVSCQPSHPSVWPFDHYPFMDGYTILNLSVCQAKKKVLAAYYRMPQLPSNNQNISRARVPMTITVPRPSIVTIFTNFCHFGPKTDWGHTLGKIWGYCGTEN